MSSMSASNLPGSIDSLLQQAKTAVLQNNHALAAACCNKPSGKTRKITGAGSG